jgi:hypothetical protein
LAVPVSLTFHSALRKLITEPSMGASHQLSVHLNKHGSRRKFLFLIVQFLKIFFSETAEPNEPKLRRKYQQRRRFLEIEQSETKISCGCHVC